MNSHRQAWYERYWRLLGSFIFFVICVVLSILWFKIEAEILGSIPSGLRFDNLTVSPDIKELVIGQRELGQRPGWTAAEPRHLGITNVSNELQIYNVAAQRRVLLHYQGFGSLYLHRWEIRRNDRLRIGSQEFLVTEVEPSSHLQLQTSQAVYNLYHQNGYSVHIESHGEDGFDPPRLENTACDIQPATILDKIRDKIIEHLEHWKHLGFGEELLLARIGGGVDCSDRISVPGVDPDSLRLVYKNNEIFFAPGKADKNQVYFQRDGHWKGFSKIGRPLFPDDSVTLGGKPLGHVDWLILGRTRYQVSKSETGGFILSAQENIHRYFNLNELPEDQKGVFAAAGNSRLEDMTNEPPNGVKIVLSNNLSPVGGQSLIPTWADLRAGLDTTDDTRRAKLMRLLMGVMLSGFIVTFVIHKWIVWAADSRRIMPFRAIDKSPSRTAMLVGAAVAFTLLFWMLRSYADILSRREIGIMLIGNWWLATLSMTRVPGRDWRLSVFWLLMSIIIIAGALGLELLSVGATQTRWLKYDYKHLFSISVAFLIVVLVMSIHMDGWRYFIERIVHSTKRAHWLIPVTPLLLLTVIFLLWGLLGREEGLGVIQPMELGKLMAVLMFCLVIVRFDYNRRYSHFWSRFGRFLSALMVLGLAYVMLFAAIPALKHDFSPILILAMVGLLLLVMSALWLWIHRLARNRLFRKRRAVSPGEQIRFKPLKGSLLEMLTVIISLFLVLVAFFWGSYEWDRVKDTHLTEKALDYSTIEQRVAVRISLKDHPEYGDQLAKSFRLLGATPCYTWEEKWFLLNRLGDTSRIQNMCTEAAFNLNPPSRAMSLPAVQDDFIMAFFTNRFGITGATLLGVVQILLLWVALDGALRKYAWSLGDYADDAVRQFLCFSAVGGTGLLLLHWGISWGNTLGLFPVMGQPMTWISSANSHLLFLGIPVMAITLLMLRLPNARRSKEPVMPFGPPPTSHTIAGYTWGFWGRIKQAKKGILT